MLTGNPIAVRMRKVKRDSLPLHIGVTQRSTSNATIANNASHIEQSLTALAQSQIGIPHMKYCGIKIRR